MSDLCLYTLEDLAWDDFYRCDDHIASHPGFVRECQCDHSILGDSTRDSYSVGYASPGGGQWRSPSLNQRTYTMLENDSWCNTLSGVSPSLESNSMRDASSVASENTTLSHYALKSNKMDSINNEICTNNTILSDKNTADDSSYFSDVLGDINHSWNNLDFFENTEKDSSELLCYGWPDIENFEDVDKMFRSCDSTFEFGTTKEDELGLFESTDNIGGSGDTVKSEFEFPYPEKNTVEYTSQNQDSSLSDFFNGFSMIGDGSWTAEKSDSYMSFVNEPAMFNSKDSFIPREQLPLSYVLSNNSPSDLTSINPASCAVNTETHVLRSPLRRDPSYASIQLQHDPKFPVAAPVVAGKRERQLNHQGKHVEYSKDKFESHVVAGGVSHVPAEVGSSCIQEASSISSCMDDISQEAASFRQLQLVMEQLDLRTKICIRDSLYRLARSAEKRHHNANFNGNRAAERDAGGAFLDAGTNNFLDMETDTNPIDRSIAHLLFHRP